MRLKDVAELSPAYEGPDIDDTVSFVPMESLRCGSLDPQEISFSDAKGKYTFFADGDLLVAKVTPCFENGNIAVARGLKHGIGFGSSEIFVLRAHKGQLTGEYLFYLAQTARFQAEACATMCGVGGLKRIAPLFMRTFETEIPSPPEQRRIVAFLDEKTAAIDKRIALLERKRDTLKRLKKSVIHHAVTRGLDPNVPLKESGVEWLGKIPSHWQLVRGKDCLFVLSGFPADSNKFENDGSGIPLVRIRDISSSKTEVSYSGEYDLIYLIQHNDILVGMDGDFNVAKWSGGDALLNQRVCKLTCRNGLESEYLFHLLPFPLAAINGKKVLTTVKHLGVFDINVMFLPIPPIDEQRKMVRRIDAECAKIDAMAQIIEKQVDACHRLKRALIDEVVTGRRKVS